MAEHQKKTEAAELAQQPAAQQDPLGTDVGYIGTKVDPRPNSDYSLESGPDSPSAFEQAIDAANSRAEELRASAGGTEA